MERIIMHIDVNNAFLSWTAIDLLNNGSKYDIRDSYAVIGGDESRRAGIVLAKSMPAKRQGVVSGEPIYMARKKCKVLRTYPPNFKFYQEMSKKLFTLISEYTPDIEIASIDECYLDYTKIKKLQGEPLEFAKKLQNQIYEELGFTVNIGIANNKLCAKMASDFTKPNKIHTLYKDEIEEKMWPLEVGELFGIGKKTVPKLNKLGIKTIKDLATTKSEILYPYFKNQSQNMINWANGIEDSPVISTPPEPKGIGNEITLEKDIDDITKLNKYLLYLSERVALRIRKQKKYANVVVVILKDNTFKKYSHQKRLETATCDEIEIYEAAKKILKEIYKEEKIRLIGIRLDNLTDKKIKQVSIFDNNIEESNKINEVVDKINIKYGNKIRKASLINKKNVDIELK